MSDLPKRTIRKLRSEGPRGTLKAMGRRVHSILFTTDWEMELVPSILEEILRARQQITLIQIGAHIGNTESDQVYKFLSKHFGPSHSRPKMACRAVLVEPVRHLYQQLVRNYAGIEGVVCENVALAEGRGTKKFYRLREGINPVDHGLVPWADQLGSFLPEKFSSVWMSAANPETARDFVAANTVVEDVECITFGDLLERDHIDAVDFLQIDTEGYDYEILRTIDFGRIRPRYINYERIHLGKDEARCRDLLLDQGYRLYDHGQDTLCTLEDDRARSGRFRARLYNRWLELIR